MMNATHGKSLPQAKIAAAAILASQGGSSQFHASAEGAFPRFFVEGARGSLRLAAADKKAATAKKATEKAAPAEKKAAKKKITLRH